MTRREKRRKEIKGDLLEQLMRNGTTGKYYIDLVDKYMDFWDMENLLIDDIKDRGWWCPMIMAAVRKGSKRTIPSIRGSKSMARC